MQKLLAIAVLFAACFGGPSAWAQTPSLFMAPIFQLDYTTRFGDFSCDLSQTDEGETELLDCRYYDGSQVPEKYLEELGLIETEVDEAEPSK